MRLLQESEFDKIYRLMERSFPKSEYRPYAAQKNLLADPAYRIYTVPDDSEEIMAFIAVWYLDKLVFIEHFAVEPQYRNGGLGSRFLLDFASAATDLICLEVEIPESEIAQRRIGFYQRNGFFLNGYDYLQPALSADQEPVPLKIMTYGRTISNPEFLSLRNQLYTRVYGQK